VVGEGETALFAQEWCNGEHAKCETGPHYRYLAYQTLAYKPPQSHSPWESMLRFNNKKVLPTRFQTNQIFACGLAWKAEIVPYFQVTCSLTPADRPSFSTAPEAYQGRSRSAPEAEYQLRE